ncbi:endonuclease/exonuclease/phosphatase family protein [Congregibacter sp.]|uniref:endonuclease/exonuclease/phosphatase family protein n=1 Tax=Congregibacter sp. TaxID=2744308 RepID=UPI003F6D8E66
MTRLSSTLSYPIAFLGVLLFSAVSQGASQYQTVDACAAALETPSSVAASPLPEPLRIRSWNIMKFDLPGAEDELRGHLGHSDLMLLQESVRGLKAGDASPRYRYFSPGYKRGEEATGVEIRSRFPADVDCELQFYEPWLGTPKAVSVLRLPFKEASILLINLHAINFTLTIDDYRAQFLALSPLIRSHRGPMIVAGDFNHWNPWRADALYRWSREMGLREINFSPDWRSRHVGSAVDTLFLRGLEAVARGAFPTTRSDHHAIAASLVLVRDLPAEGADSRAPDAQPAPER